MRFCATWMPPSSSSPTTPAAETSPRKGLTSSWRGPGRFTWHNKQKWVKGFDELQRQAATWALKQKAKVEEAIEKLKYLAQLPVVKSVTLLSGKSMGTAFALPDAYDTAMQRHAEALAGQELSSWTHSRCTTLQTGTTTSTWRQRRRTCRARPDGTMLSCQGSFTTARFVEPQWKLRPTPARSSLIFISAKATCRKATTYRP